MGSPADVTVITPLYDCVLYLERCVASVQEQTLPPTKHIIVDDCSTDGSYELALALSTKYTRVPVRVLRTERNGGPAWAACSGIAAAETSHIALLGSDDSAMPDWLEVCVQAIDADPACGAVGGGYWSRHEAYPDAVEILTPCVRWALGPTAAARRGLTPFADSGCLIRLAAFRAVGGFDSSLRAGPFAEFLSRLAYSWRLRHVGRPLLHVLVRDGSVSRSRATYMVAAKAYIRMKARLMARGYSFDAAKHACSDWHPNVTRREAPSRAQRVSVGAAEFHRATMLSIAGSTSEARRLLRCAWALGYLRGPLAIHLALAYVPGGRHLRLLKHACASLWGKWVYSRLS